MITTRTWAIAGAAAALILVPTGVSYAVTTAANDTPPTAIERVQARDHAQDPVRDQERDQLRGTENCDGDGPIDDGPRAGDDVGRGGMMGGRGSGR